MLIYVSVPYNGGSLTDIIRLTQGYYHGGTRLNVMKKFCICSLWDNIFFYEPSELLIDDDGQKSTQKNVHRRNRRRRPRRCNYWPIISFKTTVRTVLSIYSVARDPPGER